MLAQSTVSDPFYEPRSRRDDADPQLLGDLSLRGVVQSGAPLTVGSDGQDRGLPSTELSDEVEPLCVLVASEGGGVPTAWEVDDVAGVGYRDPRDPGQQTLEITLEPQTAALRRLILDHLETVPGRRAAIHQLRALALHNTVFKESQASRVVREMVDERELMRLDGASSATGLSASHVVSLPPS